MELVKELLQPLGRFILVTFLATEVVKHLLRRVLAVDPARWTILFSVCLGILLAYGWTLSVLPDPVRPGFEWVAVIVTGLIIAGAAAGLFSWLEELFPWYREFNRASKAACRRR